jgi:hypothetical protein
MARRRAGRQARTPKKNADPIRALVDEIIAKHEPADPFTRNHYPPAELLEHALNGIVYQISSVRFEVGTTADDKNPRANRAGAFRECLENVALIAIHGLLDVIDTLGEGPR